jgi:hypothetical protein
LLAETPELMPACVAGIDGFWKERRGRPKAAAALAEQLPRPSRHAG